jgi:hypothetical protein
MSHTFTRMIGVESIHSGRDIRNLHCPSQEPHWSLAIEPVRDAALMPQGCPGVPRGPPTLGSHRVCSRRPLPVQLALSESWAILLHSSNVPSPFHSILHSWGPSLGPQLAGSLARWPLAGTRGAAAVPVAFPDGSCPAGDTTSIAASTPLLDRRGFLPFTDAVTAESCFDAHIVKDPRHSQGSVRGWRGGVEGVFPKPRAQRTTT